ncbi:hypothetical protein [Natrinema sp. SYSU A 869]|uniref:hypothetical protein n=1 Tax=Natrinema sp. SYSU A 869 TaxID=2871694 RepID=UPI001CA3A196|nr:hypothetical protein [Natrinema sp. SYSU A 869]
MSSKFAGCDRFEILDADVSKFDTITEAVLWKERLDRLSAGLSGSRIITHEIVSSGEVLDQLQAVLLELGYNIVWEPGQEYEELGAQRTLENEDGFL